jgi:hypothetical protein
MTKLDAQAVEALPGVRATLSYLHRSKEKPYVYTFEPPPGTPPRTGDENLVRDILIHDGRPLVRDFSLDVQGFRLIRHETKLDNLYDEPALQSVYYPELEQLLLGVTGAKKAVVFDHTFRSQRSAEERARGLREPVRRVHNDYTKISGPQRVRDLLDPAEAEERLRKRFAEVNVWRPIHGPVEEFPLAVCDASSISEADLIPTDLIYRDRRGEIYNFSYSPRHRWFYFPRMTRDEVVLIKGYDSMEDGRARFTAHSAFDDPTTPPNARRRESIEARALVFF